MQFVEEDEANGFAETIKCLADYDIPTLKDPEVGKAALTQYVESWTAAGDDQIAADRARAVGRRSTRRCPGRGFVPEGLNPEDWYTNDFAPGS